MIIRILQIQTKAELGLQTFVKIVLRVVLTPSTKLPIPLNTIIGTTNRIIKNDLLDRDQYLPE